ncbi:MAG: hypothetical protein J5938_06055 [Clostridia bacterium]|nr:hypothetical protein [Clostridia bacterium]
MDELNRNSVSNVNLLQKSEANPLSTVNRVPEYLPVQEFTTLNEIGGSETPGPGKAKTIAGRFKSLLASFAIVTVVAVSVLNLIPLNPGAVLSHASVSADEDRIYYSYAFDNFQSGDTITVRVFNDFLDEKESFKDSSGYGEAEGLKTGMKYTVEFRYKGTVVFSRSLYAGSQDSYEFSRSPDHPSH